MIVTTDITGAYYRPRLYIEFADGESEYIDEYDIGQNTSYAQAGSGSALPIGQVLGRSINLELKLTPQYSEPLTEHEWYGAEIYFILTYDDEDVDVTLPTLIVTAPPVVTGEYLQVACLDISHNLDVPYKTTLNYPTTVGAVWREICVKCGVSSAIASHAVFDITVPAALPSDLTARQVIGYIAALAGGNAYIDSHSELALQEWYLPAAETIAQHSYHDLTANHWSALTPASNSVTITGVSATVGEQEILAGVEGYILHIGSNPLITADNASDVLANILSHVGNTPISPFEGETFFNPAVEVGDAVKITDSDGIVYYSVITDVAWPLGGSTAIRCGLEAPYVPAQTYQTPAAEAVIKARELVKEERTAREHAVVDLQQAVAHASGLYETTEAAPGGGSIYYLHDKSTLAASTYVIRLTAELIAFSSDGGQTYPYGYQLDGDAVMRIVSARGVSADWIDTGALVVKDENDRVLFSADIGSGEVYIDGISVDDGVVTLGDATADSRTTVSQHGIRVSNSQREFIRLEATGAMLGSGVARIPWPGILQVGHGNVRTYGDGGLGIYWGWIYEG